MIGNLPAWRNFGPASRRTVAVAAFTGVAAGLASVLDRPLAYAFAWLWPVQLVPYAFCAMLVVVLAMATLLTRHRARVWRAQFAIATVAVMFGLHAMAFGIGPINALNITIALTTMLWLLHRFVASEARWSPTVFFHLTIVFGACALVSALNRPIPDVLPGLFVLLPKLLLVLILIDILDDRRHVDLGVGALLVSSAMVACFGIAQFSLYVVAGWDLSLVPQDSPRFVTYGGLTVLRASGLQHTPHSYAQPLAVVVAMALALAAVATGRRRAGLLLVAFLCVAAVVLSVARGQWVGLFVGVTLLPFLIWPRRTLALGIPVGLALLAVGLATGAVFWVLKSINSITESSDTIRVDLIGGGIRAMLANPFTGVGINNFAAYSPTVERYPVHNSLFQPAAELGAFGALTFVAVLVWVGIRLVVGLRAAATTHSRNQLKALLTGYTCFIVAIQFDPMAYSEFVWVFLVLAESAVRVTLRESEADLRVSAAMRGVRGPLGPLPP